MWVQRVRPRALPVGLRELVAQLRELHLPALVLVPAHRP